jgi:hypothetical protein
MRWIAMNPRMFSGSSAELPGGLTLRTLLSAYAQWGWQVAVHRTTIDRGSAPNETEARARAAACAEAWLREGLRGLEALAAEPTTEPDAGPLAAVALSTPAPLRDGQWHEREDGALHVRDFSGLGAGRLRALILIMEEDGVRLIAQVRVVDHGMTSAIGAGRVEAGLRGRDKLIRNARRLAEQAILQVVAHHQALDAEGVPGGRSLQDRLLGVSPGDDERVKELAR